MAKPFNFIKFAGNSTVKYMNLLFDRLLARSQEIAKSALDNRDKCFSSGDVITSLFRSAPGVVLFLFYYYDHCKDLAYKKAGEDLLYKTFELVNNSGDDIYYNYAYGFVGLYSVLFHLSGKELMSYEVIDYNNELDSIVDSKLQQDIESGDYDLFTGVCGYLFFLTLQAKYSLKSYSDIREKIGNLCATICRKVENDPKDGPVWNKGNGNVVLSIPHGICGWLSLLCKLEELNLHSEHSTKLRDHIVQYLLPFVSMEDKFSYSPARYNDLHSYDVSGESRLGWCYGDLGYCLSLLRYAEIIRNEDLRDTLLYMLEKTARRKDPLQNRVINAALCHGTSGIAHMFDLLSQKYGRTPFKETADYWYDKTLEFGKSDLGYSGYRNVRSTANGEYIYSDDLSLLGGISGIGLSILSRLTGNNAWNEFFFLDIT